ncbi:hypothetical protein IJG73_00465 [Candidatus Saccharibacteria bacterium]|nr:hypothetical protein [Candidatus Saccharibacteria bacterium]
MLKPVSQVYLSIDNDSPWHAQYSLGGDYLYLCDVRGITKGQLNTEVPLNPVAATRGRTVYLWEAHPGQKAIIVELLDGTSLTLRAKFTEHEFCFRCHEGEIALTVRKAKLLKLLPKPIETSIKLHSY